MLIPQHQADRRSPAASATAASSVKSAAPANRRWASRISRRSEIPAASAPATGRCGPGCRRPGRAHRSRLRVSVTGTAAMAAGVASRASSTRVDGRRVGKGRAASCTRTLRRIELPIFEAVAHQSWRLPPPKIGSREVEADGRGGIVCGMSGWITAPPHRRADGRRRLQAVAQQHNLPSQRQVLLRKAAAQALAAPGGGDQPAMGAVRRHRWPCQPIGPQWIDRVRPAFQARGCPAAVPVIYRRRRRATRSCRALLEVRPSF